MSEVGKVIKECPNCGSHYMELKTDIKNGDVCIVCMSCGEYIVDNRRPTRRFCRGDVVSHFKGSYYEIIYPRAKCCTNGKEEGYVVIYKDFGSNRSSIYVRDYDEFMSKVDFSKYPDSEQEYRFEYRFNVDDKDY